MKSITDEYFHRFKVWDQLKTDIPDKLYDVYWREWWEHGHFTAPREISRRVDREVFYRLHKAWKYYDRCKPLGVLRIWCSRCAAFFGRKSD